MAEKNVVDFHIDYDSGVSTGGRVIAGTFTMGNGYHASGDIINLLNYYNSTSYPTVVVSSASGYILSHDRGTATGGKIKAYQMILNTTTVNGTAANVALYEVHTLANLATVNASFIAFGERPLNV